ncbi:MAG: hypothetical protein AABY26_00825 [Nanoarchaeota archaeon]
MTLITKTRGSPTVEEIVLRSLPKEQNPESATSKDEYYHSFGINQFCNTFKQEYANKRGGIWGEGSAVACEENEQKVSYSLGWFGASKLADKVREGKVSVTLAPSQKGELYASVVRSFQRLAGEGIGGAVPQMQHNFSLDDKRTYCTEIIAGLYLLNMLETPTCTELLSHLLRKKPILSEYIHEAIGRYAPIQLGLDFDEGGKEK